MTNERWIRPMTVAILTLGVIAASIPPSTLAGDGEVRIAHLTGTTTAPVYDVADCSSSFDASARYFVSVQDAVTGTDITTATGQLNYTGPAPYPFDFPLGVSQTVTMTSGNLESQANDGTAPTCTAATNDTHTNDLGSSFVPSWPNRYTWNMAISATGYTSQTISLASFTDGVGACPLGDRMGCLISLGTISLQPVGAATATATVTPTATIGPSTGPGGRGFTVRSEAGGQVVLTWRSGTGQTGYDILRVLASGPATFGRYAASTTSYTDIMPVGKAFVCYQVIVQKASPPPGRSDFLCLIRGVEFGLGPTGIGVQLNEGDTATVSWTTPTAGTQTGYVLVPLGTTRTPPALSASATSATDPTGGTFTCYVVVAVTGSTAAGLSDVACAFPRLSSGL